MIEARAPTCAIAVMAKAPQPGRSKTRMCPPLSPEDAARLSGAFLRDTTENLVAATRQALIVPYAAYAPAGSESLLRSHLAPQTRLIIADGTPPMPDDVQGFGRCLLHAVSSLLDAGHAAACVLSSDGPTLPTRRLVQAAQALLAPGDRAVLGPADDGGYYLLGLKAAYSHMFAGIAWSTEVVADQTRIRATQIGLPLVELEPWHDADDAASLSVLLADERGYPAPHTRRLAATMDLGRMLETAVSP